MESFVEREKIKDFFPFVWFKETRKGKKRVRKVGGNFEKYERKFSSQKREENAGKFSFASPGALNLTQATPTTPLQLRLHHLHRQPLSLLWQPISMMFVSPSLSFRIDDVASGSLTGRVEHSHFFGGCGFCNWITRCVYEYWQLVLERRWLRSEMVGWLQLLKGKVCLWDALIGGCSIWLGFEVCKFHGLFK